MSSHSTPAEQAAAVRHQAKRARRLADGLPEGPDRERLLQHARELERQAAELEKKASGDRPVRSGQREQQQTQEQQQQGEDPAPPGLEPKTKT